MFEAKGQGYGGKSKYKRYAEQEKNGSIRLYELTCVLDGSTQTFVDEGPFPSHGPNWESIAPSGGRQRLLAKLRQQTADKKPMWVSPVALPPVFDPDIKRDIDIPVITPQVVEQIEANLVARETVAESGRKAVEQRKKNADQELKAQAAAMFKAANAAIAEEAPAKAAKVSRPVQP